MKKNTVLIFALFILLNFITSEAYANKDSLTQVRKDAGFTILNRSLIVYDVKTVQAEDWTKLFRVPEHPTFDNMLTPEVEQEILTQINERRRAHGNDTLLTSDCFYIWRPYFDWLHNIDPHYKIFTEIGTSRKDYASHKQFNNDPGSRRLPFETYLINDTLIVRDSFDPLFKVGDMIVSINDVTIPEYFKYSYNDRYASTLQFMLYYYYSFAVDNFKIRLVRDGKHMEFATNGCATSYLSKQLRAEVYNPKIFEDAKCGYVQVRRFYPHNGRLIKIVSNAIADFKKQGCKDVIIDIRRNPGGSGHSFDKLLSIFIDKPSIPYIKSQKLKVSQQTLGDYDFLTEDMIGQLIDIPDEHLVKEVKLNPKMYVDGMNYYILVSKNTGSIAASFANILQYNDAAIIAGEPLLNNALKYGETIVGEDLLPTLLAQRSISTTEIEEHTRVVDGVLMPDIYIPFVAKEYLTGKDAVLEQLLDTISSINKERLK